MYKIHMKKFFPDYQIYTREEEHEVFLKIRAGEAAAKKLESAASDEKKKLEKIVEEGKFARDDMLMHNVKLAYDYVLKYCISFIEKRPDCEEDLVMWIILGINHAIDLYDPDSGNKFSTYAYTWIRHHASLYMYRESYILGYYNSIYTSIDKYKNFCDEYKKYIGESPDEPTVLNKLKFSKKTLDIVKQALLQQVDLDFEYDDGSTIGDYIDSGYDLARSVEEKLVLEDVRKKLEILTPREKKIIELYYGFGNYEPCSIPEAEKKMGIGKGVGNSLLEKARRKLRKHIPVSYAASI